MSKQSKTKRTEITPLTHQILMLTALEAPQAVFETVARVVDIKDYGSNALTAAGDLVSKALRRRILLRFCEALQWRLSDVSEVLGLGGAGNVTRMLVELGAGAELEAARVRGLALPGRQRGPRNKKRA